jgi:hypothetical protein
MPTSGQRAQHAAAVAGTAASVCECLIGTVIVEEEEDRLMFT